MRVSKNFLSDFIDTSCIDTKELAKQLPLIGNEVEQVEYMCHINNLIIGQIEKIEKHPNADKLNVCQVNVGEEVTQIVCGAKNVSEGIKVIVALPGAILPGDIRIEKTTIRDVVSNGMICAFSELGIDSKYENDKSKDGIYILEDEAIVGSDPTKTLALKDDIIDVELTSNRGDLLSILGMSYEIGALYALPIILPDISYKEEIEKISDELTLNVSTVNNPLYIAKMVKNIKIKESPWFIKSRLIASGIRPINNVVDISNYVMLEYGQPLHFFDKKKLGREINVRMAKNDEECITLDGEKRILSDDDIVITNGNSIIALAGVMGCLNSEITNDTTDIVIESAIFNPRNIRLTSKKILCSEASTRFEKGLDTEKTHEAIKRACHLLSKYANATILSDELIHNEIDKINKIITISYYKIVRLLGMNLTIDEILNVFNRLEFPSKYENGTFSVLIPSRRLDISIEEDLIEEIGRMMGYDKMIGKLPYMPVKSGGISYKQKYRKSIRDRLVSLGLDNVISYSLTKKENLEKFTNDVFNHIEVSSPLSEDKKVYRHSIIPSLIQIYNYNNSRSIKDVNIFEMGSTYYQKDGETKEDEYLSILMSGNYISNSLIGNIKVDFYVLKGVIENLLKYLKLNGRYEFVSDNLIKEYHPYQCAKIIVDKEVIGYFGKVHPNISNDVFVCEINILKLLNKKIRELKCKEVSKYPTISKDVAFIVDKNIEAGYIINGIKKVGGKILTNIEVFDIYENDDIGINNKSIAFNLNFSDVTKTLTDEEVMSIFNKIIDYVEKNCNAKLRSNRG